MATNHKISPPCLVYKEGAKNVNNSYNKKVDRGHATAAAGTGLWVLPASMVGGEERARKPCQRPGRAGRRPAIAWDLAAWGGPVRA
eukprot:scaffold245248_cov31-Tisochrysis_lutea.AAC.1